MSSTLTQVDHRVGKEIAHLTYVRSEVTDEMNNWPFIEIANDVKRVLAVFVDAVPKSRVASLCIRAEATTESMTLQLDNSAASVNQTRRSLLPGYAASEIDPV